MKICDITLPGRYTAFSGFLIELLNVSAGKSSSNRLFSSSCTPSHRSLLFFFSPLLLLLIFLVHSVSQRN